MSEDKIRVLLKSGVSVYDVVEELKVPFQEVIAVKDKLSSEGNSVEVLLEKTDRFSATEELHARCILAADDLIREIREYIVTARDLDAKELKFLSDALAKIYDSMFKQDIIVENKKGDSLVKSIGI